MSTIRFLNQRFAYGDDTTGGRWFEEVNGVMRPFKWGLEDERREVKVYGETCIPPAVYELVPRTEGEMWKKYCMKFGPQHRMIHLQPDPVGFTLVMVHIGNWAYEGEDAPPGMTKDDTKGCPLIGNKLIMTEHGEFELRDSTPAYLALNAKCETAWQQGDKVFLTVSEKWV